MRFRTGRFPFETLGAGRWEPVSASFARRDRDPTEGSPHRSLRMRQEIGSPQVLEGVAPWRKRRGRPWRLCEKRFHRSGHVREGRRRHRTLAAPPAGSPRAMRIGLGHSGRRSAVKDDEAVAGDRGGCAERRGQADSGWSACGRSPTFRRLGRPQRERRPRRRPEPQRGLASGSAVELQQADVSGERLAFRRPAPEAFRTA